MANFLSQETRERYGGWVFNIMLVVMGLSLLVSGGLTAATIAPQTDRLIDPVTFITHGEPEEPLCAGEPLSFKSIVVFNKDQTTFINSALVKVDVHGQYITTITNPTSSNLAGQWREFRGGDRVPADGWNEFTVRGSDELEPGYYQYRISYNTIDGTTTRHDIGFEVVDCQ